jgi:hypothetical protein
LASSISRKQRERVERPFKDRARLEAKAGSGHKSKRDEAEACLIQTKRRVMRMSECRGIVHSIFFLGDVITFAAIKVEAQTERQGLDHAHGELSGVLLYRRELA